MKYNNYKKLFLSFLLITCLFAMFGCTSNEAKALWNKFVKGVNNQDINLICDTLYSEEDSGREEFLSSNYLSELGVSTIKTNKFTVDISCDFSSSIERQIYYKAIVNASFDGNEKEIELYMYTNNNGIFFCSPVTKEGNTPSELWLSQVYYTTEDGSLLYSGDEEIKILRSNANNKKVVIPSEIDGKKVTTISKYAFYRFGKILCFTYPKSKLSEVVIPEGIELIDEYAFFQCTKLKTISIPQSVNKISAMAFTGCSGLKEIHFLKETEETPDRNELTSVSVGGGDHPLVIKNAYDMLEGEIITLSILKYDDEETIKTVRWSSTSDKVSVNADTGEITALSSGTAIIRVEYKDNPQIYATVSINVEAMTSRIEINNDAFNRCHDLEAIYISAYNPNTFKIGGTGKTQLNLSSKVLIYVPKGSLKMYSQNKYWSGYASQLREME